MIGVIPKADQLTLVEEFFELFKTPWEFYKPGRRYDVVVATADELPRIDAKLLLVYGCETKTTDASHGTTICSQERGGSLQYEGMVVPVYGGFATLEQGGGNFPCLTAPEGTAALRSVSGTGDAVIRIGYDLFREVQLLLTDGQPVEYANIPALDTHIQMLRDWILGEGIPLLEVCSAPSGHSFTVCLTHDIDFLGIRNHKFDHTMWGFLYRSTVGATWNFLRRNLSIRRLVDCWRAAASLPFVYLGWAKDFWSPFEWYLRVEKGLPATYFLIPFKRRAGDRVPGTHARRRAATYDVGDLARWTAALQAEGCEVGVHGIDAWHNAEKGRAEFARIANLTEQSAIGIRMHWLLNDAKTTSMLEEAGYAYDSTLGYNETIGYRNGTTQVFRPVGARNLLELPLNIQDGALFRSQNLNLRDSEAESRCRLMATNARQLGGVLTVLWHDRSHAAERFWGDFYIRFVQALRSSDAWFATAAQAVGWFKKRRQVRFECVPTPDGEQTRICYAGEQIQPPLRVRLYEPATRRGEGAGVDGARANFTDVAWSATHGDQQEFQLATLASALPS